MTPIDIPTLNSLCEKEFELVRNEAYRDLDRSAANIREHFGSRGLARSSSLGQSIVDEVLARYDSLLAGFEKTYVGKWSETDRELTESDYKWLSTKAMSVLQVEAQEAQTICNTLLYEPSLFFQVWWQKVGPEARTRNNNIFKKIEILKLQKGQKMLSKAVPTAPEEMADQFATVWSLLHPKVVEVAQKRFNSGHYADAAEAVFKEINEIVRRLVKVRTGKEYDGASLMQCAFSLQNPILKLDDLGNETGRNIQVGYMQIFSGAMTGVRNPKAHANIQIDAVRSIHFMFLASLLLSKIDERIL